MDELLERHLSRASPHFQRFRALVGFFIRNKKLINSFVRVNNQVVNSELKGLAMRVPEVLEFETKRIIWRVELKRLHTK